MLDIYFERLSDDRKVLVFDAFHTGEFERIVIESIDDKTAELADLNFMGDKEELQKEYMKIKIELDTLQSIIAFITKVKLELLDMEK